MIIVLLIIIINSNIGLKLIQNVIVKKKVEK